MTRRYVIYGAGAVGGVIGGCLALAGMPVTLIARGRHLDALRSSGLELRLPDATHHLDVPAVADPAEAALTVDDVVILAMKSQHTGDALATLAAAAPADVAVVCAQNGVENERLALRRFARVYALCVYLPAYHLEPGVVESNGTPFPGVLDLGRYPAGVDDTARAVAADLTAAGFRSEANPAVLGHKYAKLRMNTTNALDAACGPGARTSDLARRIRDETDAVFAAAGIPVAAAGETGPRWEGLAVAPAEGRELHTSSSWQSLARGTGSIEADHLNGEVVLLGRLNGIATPANETILRIANQMAAERALPGSMPLDEVAHLMEKRTTELDGAG